MAQIGKTIITAIANKSDAIALSVLNGQAQFTFAGNATSVPGSALPTHCLASGMVDEVVIARYASDPRFFVSDSWGPNWPLALQQYSPVLSAWYDPADVL